jgi:hypothetical protein
MASNVKRFMFVQRSLFLSFLFVGLLALQVKPVFAQNIWDEVISMTLPYELQLKKTGPVRLGGLLYDKDATGLETLVKTGDRVRVRFFSDTPDRYGRKPVDLYLKDSRWVQGELVRNAQAIPYPYPKEENHIRDLYVLENPHPLSALSDQIKPDGFAIIKGHVVDVAIIKGTTYLNFGANWRDDFTIRINRNKEKLFKSYGLDLNTLKGRHIQIRGWVINQNGPMIVAEHPTQIQLIAQ